MENNAFFDEIMKFCAVWEGGLSDDAADRGGITKYGVSIEFLKDLKQSKTGRSALARVGITEKTAITRDLVKKLTPEDAKSLFYDMFFVGSHANALPPLMSFFLFDASVNSGSKQGLILSQRAVNLCEKPGIHLVEDGLWGPNTLKILGNPEYGNSEEVFLNAVYARKAFYRKIVANRPSQSVFLKGWLNRAEDMKRFAKDHYDEWGVIRYGNGK